VFRASNPRTSTCASKWLTEPNHKFAANIFTTNLRLVKVSSKIWLKFFEIKTYFELTIWACGADVKRESFDLLLKRFKTLYNKMGPKGLFYYLKEALRQTICFLADQPVTVGVHTPYVRRDSHGLPTIIPWLLRKEILSFKAGSLRDNKGIVVCILTVLSIFRVFANKVRPNLASILEPFNGTVRTFDSKLLKRALKSLALGPILIRPPKLLLIEKASPNSSKATWASSVEAVAFLFYPRVLISYILYAISVPRGWLWLAWMSGIMFVSIPIVLILSLIGGPVRLCIAKLSVVYDQAGKARIVGITNWWIQIILQPLHTAILSQLRKIPMDGTFDQISPVKRLVDSVPSGQRFYSFDLSAATDRLPIEIQRDILNILIPGLGTKWANLLGSLSWQWTSLNKKSPVREYKYSVGQPMGAYSSWAMLALSHHIIVQVASLNCGKSRFKAYAVLGDDIVIADDDVASEYLKLMKMLGLEINLSKSLISKDFCEFAKRWIGPSGLDLSPLGPGLILRLCRNRFYMAALLTQMFDLGIIRSIEETLARVSHLPPKFQGQKWNALWAAFGLNSFVMKKSQDGTYNFMHALSWCFSLSERTASSAPFLIKSALLQTWIWDKAKAQSNLDAASLYFVQNFWSIMTTHGWPNRILEFLLKLVGPGVWSYFLNFVEQQRTLDNALGAVSKDFSVSGLQHAVQNAPFNIDISNIDWKDRTAVKENIDRANDIVKAFDQQLDDLRFDERGDFY